MNTFKYLCMLLLFPISILAQNTVTGTVVDDQGLPIPGINILVEDTQRGTTTDFDGNYSINVSDGEVLVFSYLGFETKKVIYKGQNKIDVKLMPDQEQLEEVVLIGYGASKKKDLTGSVTSITEDDFTKGNIVTAESLINGRVAGVSVTSGGAPGSSGAIRIRGGGSLSANNDPLFVIDGLPLRGSAGGRSILSSINPNDIESFSILKDAAATAIYGNRASGGVIIIETKKGSKKLKVDFNSGIAFYDVFNQIDVFNANEFRNIIAQQRPDDVSLLGDANTNWQEAIFRTGNHIDNNLSVSGSLFDKLPVRLSLGRFDQKGVLLTDKYERNTVSLALNPTFFEDKLRINVNANYTREFNRFADQGAIGNANIFDPTQPVYDENSPFGGYFEYFTIGPNGLPNRRQAPVNPVALLEQRNNEQDKDRFYGNLNIDYRLHFLPQVRAVINLGIDDSNASGTNELSRESINGQLFSDGTFNGSFTSYENSTRNTLADAYLKYNQDITKDVSVRATLGYSYQKFENSSFNSNDRRAENVLEPESFVGDDLILIGYIGRTFVTLKDKYIFSYSIRRDGSSRFSEGNKFGIFQAAAFSWNISDEKFLEDSSVISNLKLRASYGETGQQEVGPAILGNQNYTTSLENSQFFFGNSPFPAAFPTAFNPTATWETAKTINLGLDYGLFNDRITGSLDVYTRDTENLYINAPVPEGANFTNQIQQNTGVLNTQGLEIGINAQIFDSKGDKDKFDWNVNYNLTYINQELTELPNEFDIPSGFISGGAITAGNIQLNRVGNQPNMFWVYNQIYDNDGNPIEGAFSDLNGDNVINDEDRYLYRNPDANVLMGFQSTMRYKNIDFSFNFRASLNNYVYNNVNSREARFNRLKPNEVLGNIPTNVLETGFESNLDDILFSDIFVEDASFLRMDNIQLGYTFSPAKDSNATMRLSMNVQNPFIITDYSGTDPEVFGGIDNQIYPRQRTFLFGVNYSF